MPLFTRRSFIQLACASAAALSLPFYEPSLYAESTRVLLPANVCGKFGFIDAKGAMAVPARYDAVLPFATDYAAVHRDGS